MSPNPNVWRKGRAVLLLFLIISVTSAVAVVERAKKRPNTPDEASTESIPKPQLLNADTDPTLRYPVARMGHGVLSLSFGWFDVTRSSARYEVVVPPGRAGDSFGVSRKEIESLDFQGLFMEFQSLQGNDCRNSPGCAFEGSVVVKNKQMIFYLPQSQWGTVHGGPGVVRAAERGSHVTGSIYEAIRHFDRALALVKPPAPPAVVAQPVATPPPEPKPAMPPVAPTIVLSAPSGAGANQVIELKESPLVIRGVAMDTTGIPVVSINGALANMRPQNAQAAEFWTDPLPLQSGGNRIQIVASNSAHVEAHLVFIVHYTPKPPPNPRALSKPQIISLLRGGVLATRIADLIKDRGISFMPTADDLGDIRAAGGNDEVIQAVQQAALPPR
jgi:hypothetical protein